MAQFRIDTETKTIAPLTRRTFGELGFTERGDLQEWIAKQPSCLGDPELLLIAKEFTGFDTRERPDLLALDKNGELVVIENKLDDTGRDVTWQALKYASYCSRLTTEEIHKIYQDLIDKTDPDGPKAAERIAKFLGPDYDGGPLNKGNTPRIILIAATFRREVTSTVLWLLEFGLRIQCFQITPYSLGEEHFLNIEQIIPIQDAQEFMIGIANKSRDEVETEEKNRHKVRRQFWTEIVRALEGKTTRFNNITPGPYSTLGAGSGVRGVWFEFGANRTSGRAEIYIDRGAGSRNENKFIYDQLHRQKNTIEAAFGGELIWEPVVGERSCRIKAETPGNIFVPEHWPPMIAFMTDAMVRLEKAFREPIAAVNRELRKGAKADAVFAAVAPIPEAAGG